MDRTYIVTTTTDCRTIRRTFVVKAKGHKEAIAAAEGHTRDGEDIWRAELAHKVIAA